MSVRDYSFTPAEVSAFVSVSEKRVRKEIEYRIIDVPTPPRLGFATLVYLRALESMELNLGVEDRIKIYRGILGALETDTEELRLSELLTLRLKPLIEDISTRVMRFLRWKESLVENLDIMGGEAVFPESRLTVRHVGEMLERGESADVLLEDYPYLRREDLDCARLFVRAYPRVGRPRAQRKDPR